MGEYGKVLWEGKPESCGKQYCENKCNLDADCKGFDFRKNCNKNDWCRLYPVNNQRVGNEGNTDNRTYCAKPSGKI